MRMFVNHMSGVDFLPKKKERKAETEEGEEVEKINTEKRQNLHLLLVLGVKPSV